MPGLYLDNNLIWLLCKSIRSGYMTKQEAEEIWRRECLRIGRQRMIPEEKEQEEVSE